MPSAKRILILKFPNLNNYGTAMMGINAMQLLHDHGASGMEFLCDFHDTMRVDVLRSELGRWNSPISRFPGIPETIPSLFYNIAKPLRPLMRARWLAKQCDAIVVLGGDDFSGSLDWRALVNSFVCGLSMPVVYLGQTAGPFPRWRDRQLAKLLFRKCRIVARDPWSVEYFRDELGIRSVDLGADLAWIDLPHQNDRGLFEVTAQRYGLERNGYVSIVVSQLWERYTGNRELYLDRWVEIVIGVLQHEALRSKKLCLLPHTIGPNYGDERELLIQVLEKVPDHLRPRVVVVDAALYPTRTRLILGNGCLTITGRMHAAVSTFQMGCPAISLAYSTKYEGVISQAMGRADLLIKAAVPEKWQNGLILREIIECVDYVVAKDRALRQSISDAARKQKELATNSVREVGQWISDS